MHRPPRSDRPPARPGSLPLHAPLPGVMPGRGRIGTVLLLVLMVWGGARADSLLSLTEFMASNGRGLRDENGDYPDWIEIFNAGPDAANLGGWRLTDAAADLAKWTLPETNLAANARLVVFASGKDRAVAGRQLHASFSLNADGEYLALVSPEGEVVSAFAPGFPPQFVDVSYGVRLGREYYFPQPTPGAENVGGYNDFVADTKFSHDRGFHTQAFDLVITTATAGATIVYTTNGSLPVLTAVRTNGTVYAAPVPVRGTTTLRAAAFKDGFQPSNVDTHTYVFVDDVIRQSPSGQAPGTGWPAPGRMSTGQVMDYGMDPDVVNDPRYSGTIRDDLRSLPSFSIVMDLNDLFSTGSGIYANPGQDTRAWERKCSLELLHLGGQDGFQIDCGIRIRGGFSRSGDNPKHAFRFFFREVYGATKLRYPLFGDAGADSFDGIDLRTFQNYSWSFQGDGRGVFVRDQLSRDLQLAMGHQAERGEYYHLYVNGHYWGLFNTCERPEASFAETYYGGRAEDYDVVKSSADAGYTIGATDGNMQAWTRLYNQCRAGLATDAAFERVLGNNPDGTPNPAYERLVDLENLMDYMLVIVYGGNLDAPISWFLGNNSPNNWFGSRNRLGPDGFRFFVHDAEHTLLDVNEDRCGPFAAGNSSVSASSPQWVWQKMWDNAEFRVRMGDRIHRHFFNGGLLTPGAVRERFVARTSGIERAVVGESARWGDAKRSTPFTLADWRNQVNSIRDNYLPARSQVVLGQLRSRGLYPTTTAPAFHQHGGLVPPGFPLSMSAPAGTILYTLDGSDPRQRGGDVSPAALTYTGPVRLDESVEVRSRVRSGTDWSALNTATFLLLQTYTNLVITEIHYHPADHPDRDADDFEFLELKNLNATAIDLGGVSFTNGVRYTFPLGRKLGPGEFIVLARNPEAFALRYPGVIVDGAYEGGLANGGERLTLVHASGTRLFSVAYADAPPWPAAADGTGFSLVPVQPALPFDPDAPASWRASARVGGSPGADDLPPDLPPVVINEVLTHTDPPLADAIELHNPGATPADVGGWYLTDDRNLPQRYRIPAGTRIPAGGYLVVHEAAFNPTPGVEPSFSLSSHGEEVWLFSGNAAGTLTGYADGLGFGAAANAVTFGRFTNSAGTVQFPAQTARTLGAANAGPRIGPVVINEIRYQPAAGDDEFIELKNLTDAPVPLFNPEHPDLAWRLDGFGFEFPPGIELAPRGLLVVAASDPAGFRDRNSIPASVPVFGPASGSLQNSGERLELQRPDAPDLETNALGEVRTVIPYIAVDVVRYNDRPPWPTNAAGLGPSLERLQPGAYGDDPANWRDSFGPASPGLENDGNRPPIVRAGADQEGVAAAYPFALTLAGGVTDDGRPGPPAAVTSGWSQLSGPGRVVFADPSSPSTPVLVPGPGDYVLRLSAADGEVSARDDVIVSVRRPSSQVTLLPAGSEWRYLDDGSDQGTNWVTTAFNDASWKAGRAQLGYSTGSPEGDEVTIVGYGGNASAKYITTYFRARFHLADAAAVTQLTARLLRDDGAAVYLNGWPAFRDNLPTGPLTYTTRASSAVGGADESTFYEFAMDPARLQAGVNVLAVEVHQNAPTSSDLSFDFQLDALAFPANQPPTASAGPDRTVTAGAWVTLHGAFTDDGLPADPGAPVMAWTKVSGPGEVLLTATDAWVTDARFALPGTYVLRLTVNDGTASAADEVRITAERGEAPSPVIGSIEVLAGPPRRARIEFGAEAGWRYVVEARSLLTEGAWETVADLPAGDQPRAVEVEEPLPAEGVARFYRVTVLPGN